MVGRDNIYLTAQEEILLLKGLFQFWEGGNGNKIAFAKMGDN